MNRYVAAEKLKDLTYNAPLINAPVVLLGKHVERKHFTREPILIVGSPRAGTTLLFSMLAALPSVFAVSQQTYAFKRWENRGGRQIPRSLFRLYRQFLRGRIPATANRWLEKSPVHVLSIRQILDYFQDAVKIIHIIRDGRDVAVSSHPAYTDRRKYWVPVEQWVRDVRCGLQYRDHARVHTLRYEDLVGDHETQLKKILAFIDEPFGPEIADWAGHTPIRQSIHWGGAIKPLHQGSIGNWKKPEHADRLREFMNNESAVTLLQELGYQEEQAPPAGLRAS